MSTYTPPDSQVYYASTYWNDIPQVLEYICENCTGDRTKWWIADFKERFCSSGPFEHGLFLNCGNGWVERDFMDRGIVSRATAFDYSEDLLEGARRDQGDRPITYFQADANLIDMEADTFDLVVNVGALHHVQYIDRMCRVICKAMTSNGVLVSFDYVGPARNQYSKAHWRLVQAVNRSLPATVRKEPLVYPHLPTMLVTDPTEAIHSDLVIPSIARYFDIAERHDVGGGIAYELLTHNENVVNRPPSELAQPLQQVLTLDRKYTEEGRVPSLFSYFIARPVKSSLDDRRLLQFQRSEASREALAARRSATYSLRDFIQLSAHNLLAGRPKTRRAQLARRVWFGLGRRMRQIGRRLR